MEGPHKITRPSDRPMRRRVPIGEPEAHVAELAALAELMLAAAWADGDKHPVEIIAIAEMLKEFVGSATLPAHVSATMERFEMKRFDVATAISHIPVEDDEERLAVVQLLARVTGADRVLTQSELAFLKHVAGALGLDPDIVHIEVRFA
jgi:uncharacterized tellurite resistance protein B-like protein